MTVTNQSGAIAYMSELSIALFVPTLTQQNELSLHTTENRWGDTPILKVRGDMINDGEETFCVGVVRGEDKVQFHNGASRENAGSVITFTLEEINNPFDSRM